MYPFFSSFNKLLTERDEIQANYELIKEQLYGLKELESELASISAEEEVAAELINQCIRENACVALNSKCSVDSRMFILELV
jgi:site-specific DNA recombinase